ncbi:sigma-54-dependent transcriptional regulator [Chryseobacterium caseinilyticum]|uniref:Sigma-54-dependent Fis family transcriptional regulator n=1 Tax=Chryseobacterium caseinilyticum TaxID=2771428 RepID=A0ABR8Z6Z0_9FLAO|nr:sigma-54 dependent transcriptional regulator [Chryseobacterium caseinilyticum]MBD8081062.1 sigma-54-dependent Fis family transcriptional regulator [Chryseobacterium caseinilyticum]
MNTILIIDDEAKIRSLLSRIISLEGFEVSEASNLKSGLKKLETLEIDIVICDVKLPDGNGVEFSKIIKEKFPVVEVILLTAFGNIPDGVMAIKNGAFDYITKGDDNTRILPLIYKASEKVALNKRVLHLEKQLNRKQSFDSIIGKSSTITGVVESARKVANTDATVLLTGETGTGKEVFAQAIHHASKRNKNNFIAINCSAFGKDLLENELFGHKAGAFTGALKDSKGIFEEANQGTVFLDEIGEMPLDLQAKLLRVLESGEFLKVGDNKPIKTNVRIVAATNRDLESEIEKGNFREDLYYRINIFQIKLPSLRERTEDIELLVRFFLKSFSLKTGKNITSISPDYLKALKNHPWKGNIRELRNVIERSVILTDSSELDVDSLPLDISISNDQNSSQIKIMSAFSMASAEKMQIQKVLNHTKGNKAEAARLLEIGIATLYRKVEEYKIS